MKAFLLKILHSVCVIFIISGVIFAATNLNLSSGDVINKAAWDEIIAKVNSAAGSGIMPTGAVMAFNLAECPIGWSDYTPAQGRVIRGIDKTGTSIDPDGQRALESIQEDAIRNITGKFKVAGPDGGIDGVTGAFYRTSSNGQYVSPAGRTSAVGSGGFDASRAPGVLVAPENRMKNVALLYCVKD